MIKHTTVIAVAILTIGCTNTQPVSFDFHYNQKVIVTSGFYKGLSGEIEAPAGSYSDCPQVYEVYLLDGPGRVELCGDRLELKND